MRGRLRSWVICPLVMSARCRPGRGARWVRGSRLVKPPGGSLTAQRAASRDCPRGPVMRIPAIGVPDGVVMGSLTAASAVISPAGLWLILWAPGRRRLAVKPACRSAGRLGSRLPGRKSAGLLMVVSVRRARAFGGCRVDEHQYVQALAQHGVHVQEIDRENPGGLGIQKLPPGEGRAARGRIDAGGAQDLPDCGR